MDNTSPQSWTRRHSIDTDRQKLVASGFLPPKPKSNNKQNGVMISPSASVSLLSQSQALSYTNNATTKDGGDLFSQSATTIGSPVNKTTTTTTTNNNSVRRGSLSSASSPITTQQHQKQNQQSSAAGRRQSLMLRQTVLARLQQQITNYSNRIE
jgi:hypothetical protein